MIKLTIIIDQKRKGVKLQIENNENKTDRQGKKNLMRMHEKSALKTLCTKSKINRLIWKQEIKMQMMTYEIFIEKKII